MNVFLSRFCHLQDPERTDKRANRFCRPCGKTNTIMGHVATEMKGKPGAQAGPLHTLELSGPCSPARPQTPCSFPDT